MKSDSTKFSCSNINRFIHIAKIESCHNFCGFSIKDDNKFCLLTSKLHYQDSIWWWFWLGHAIWLYFLNLDRGYSPESFNEQFPPCLVRGIIKFAHIVIYFGAIELAYKVINLCKYLFRYYFYNLFCEHMSCTRMELRGDLTSKGKLIYIKKNIFISLFYNFASENIAL